MLFMYIHTHTPENCTFGEPQKGMQLFSRLRENFQKAGITVSGAYVANHEHTAWWLLEANNIRDLEVALTPLTKIGTARLIPVDTHEFMKS